MTHMLAFQCNRLYKLYKLSNFNLIRFPDVFFQIAKYLQSIYLEHVCRSFFWMFNIDTPFIILNIERKG